MNHMSGALKQCGDLYCRLRRLLDDAQRTVHQTQQQLKQTRKALEDTRARKLLHNERLSGAITAAHTAAKEEVVATVTLHAVPMHDIQNIVFNKLVA